jgi:hypothetical protein
MSKVILPSGIEAQIATYKEQDIEEYKGNPFIEALPDIMDKLEVVENLAVYPPYSENERNLKPHLKYHIVQRLFRYFQPLAIHIDLESRISRVIRQGYLARNPFSKEFVNSINDGHKAILNNEELSNNQYFRSTASGFTIIGASGMGKTTSINRILATIPQIIVHSKYKNQNFSMYQLIWIKLDCSFDGSIKGLCLDFFAKADTLLGTSYHKKYGNGRFSANAMLPIISQLSRQCGLGLIILDEIQHLSMAKSGGSQKMLNFFVTLVNTVGVPFIMIGTPKAMPILQGEFRQARRGSGQGDIIWGRMDKDESFKLLLEGLWEYQWTKKITPLTEEFIDVMYEESMGVTDIIVKIFVMSQIRAISSGKEEITPKLISKVAEENLKLVRPMLQALRSGNMSKIAKYTDISDINIDGFMKNELSRITLNSRVRELQQMKKQEQENTLEYIKEQAILRLIELDVEDKKAIKYVEKLLNIDSADLNVNNIVKQVLKDMFSETEEKGAVIPKRKINYKPEDLRHIVKEAKKNNITAYQSLKDSGNIKNIDDLKVRVG